ncbi:MAG TPA: hypothetical protein DHV36_09400 [Desulfobacteraceae bacterium]|nr:hypothetical protein [Desulfobacteraceae bacterium]
MMIVLTVFALSACADRRVVTAPGTHIPPDNVPQIGGPAPADTRVASRPSSVSPSPEEVRPASKKRSKALSRMLRKAERQLDQNQPDAAFNTLEQALSMDGRDPLTWHLMAKARLAQGRYRQAVSLAKKSDSLAAEHPEIKKKNAALIRKAQAGQG